jgi:hypothetical protein
LATTGYMCMPSGSCKTARKDQNAGGERCTDCSAGDGIRCAADRPSIQDWTVGGRYRHGRRPAVELLEAPVRSRA